MPAPYRTTVLHAGATLAVSEVVCRACRGGAGPEEINADWSVVFPRSGVFLRHVHRDLLCCDPGGVHFFNRGDEYRVSHPVDGGDVSTAISLRSETLRGLLHELGFVERGVEPRFARAWAPARSPGAHLVRRLSHGLRRGRILPLEADELALALVADALTSARDAGSGRERARRDSTRARRRELAHAARTRIAVGYRERIELVSLARALGCTPFHLARVFRGEFGEPLHRFQTRLRLCEALARVLDGERDLTGLALELGFCDHAHLTTSFAREFGQPPSALRRPADAGRLSKILQAARRDDV